eukprot:TRINITY_DN91292_c0_g1_i1.p1 TRINITY_DN91292_c0_g1~~TRINITY_DN91292_c0_g1_i1.p1  ORF type:complete len:432 (+),score=73.96 TRINITY_DN91292_c0_g1_i1:46-1296(+)
MGVFDDTADLVARVLKDPAVAAALARAVGGPEASFVDDACVKRYLRACEGNVQQAARALASTLEWRLRVHPAAIECSACLQDPHSHNLRTVGIDAYGRPVIYTCFSQAMNRTDHAKSMEHLTRALEDACAILASRAKTSASAKPAETCVWVADFHGYSFLKDSNPRTAILAAKLMSHYPERLGRCVLVDAPSMFAATWSAVRQVINATTASKVVFLRTDDGTLSADLQDWAKGDLAKWLLDEMADNRRETTQHGEKAYWLAPEVAGVHDARGCNEFVDSPEFSLTFTSRLCRHVRVAGEPRDPVTNHSEPSVHPGLLGTLCGNSGLLAASIVVVSIRGRSWQLASLLLFTFALLALAIRKLRTEPLITSPEPEMTRAAPAPMPALLKPSKGPEIQQTWACLPQPCFAGIGIFSDDH